MKSNVLLAFTALLCTVWWQSAGAMKIRCGKLEEVVVADSGYSASTIATRLVEGWRPEGPMSFDIDKDGNVYILDRLALRVQKYDRDGKWVLSFPIRTEAQKYEQTPRMYDVAADDSGYVYVAGELRVILDRGGKPILCNSIMKFSPDGKTLVLGQPEAMKSKPPFPFHGGELISTDKSGRVVSFDSDFRDGTTIHSPEGEFLGGMPHNRGYRDVGIVQKEVGDDIYFRKETYLLRARVVDRSQPPEIDTVAGLAGSQKLNEDRLTEDGWVIGPTTLIGFYRDTCFYFLEAESRYHDRHNPACLTLRIIKCLIIRGSLLGLGEVEIDFERGKDECSVRELFDFRKRFVVAGDGSIYFLHGTVDKIKVSKIIPKPGCHRLTPDFHSE